MPRTPVHLIYQLKAVAEFFQLKVPSSAVLSSIRLTGSQISKLLLTYQLHDFPNDAIQQFQRHVKNYRGMVGVPEREYEHWAWMAAQYASSSSSSLARFGSILAQVPAVRSALGADPRQRRQFGSHGVRSGRLPPPCYRLLQLTGPSAGSAQPRLLLSLRGLPHCEAAKARQAHG